MATFLRNEDSVNVSEQLLEVERDGQWVYSNLPQRDPKWQTTDSNGHEHAYAAGADHYPTLCRMEDTYWCADCQDEHVNVWYVCRICNARVAPGTFIDPNPTWVGGPTVYRLNGEVISAEQAQAIDQQHAQRRQAEKDRSARTSPQVSRATQAMRDEGMDEEQIRRIVDRMVTEQ